MPLSVSGFPEPSARGGGGGWGELDSGESDSNKLPRLRGLFSARSNTDEPSPNALPKSTVSAPSTPSMAMMPISKVIVQPQNSVSMHYQPWVVDDPSLIRPLPQIPSPPNLYRTSAPPRSATSPSSSPPSPSRSPIRPTLPLISSKGYKRPRTTSQGRPSRSTTSQQSCSSIPISWASRPVDLHTKRPVGAGARVGASPTSTSSYRSTGPYPTFSAALPSHTCRQTSNTIPTLASTPVPASATSGPPTSTPGSGSTLSFSFTPSSASTSTSLSSTCTSPVASSVVSKSPSSILTPHHLNTNATRMRLTITPSQPSVPTSSSSVHSHAHVPLGLSFSRLASVAGPSSRSFTQNRVQTNRIQSRIGARTGGKERGDAATVHTVVAPPASVGSDVSTTNVNTNMDNNIGVNTRKPIPPIATTTATTATAVGGVILRPTIGGPRDMTGTGQKPKLQLSLQIPSIPMLTIGQSEPVQERGQQKRKAQLPVLKLITDTSTNTGPTTSSPLNFTLSPSPSPSPSAISYMSYSHSPISPKRRSVPSPSQLSPTHSSLFSADSRLHLHPLSLSSPISLGGGSTAATHTGSGSARTSVSIQGWIVKGDASGGGGGGGGGTSPGGRSVKSVGRRSTRSVGGRSAKSTKSWRSARSNRSRRSKRSVRNNNISLPTPVAATTTTFISTPIYSKTYTHISGDHVGEYLGGDCYGYGYVEDGWGGESSPSPITYAKRNSSGNLSSDTEDGLDDGGRNIGSGVYEEKRKSGTSSEVEFADVDDDDDDDDHLFGSMRRIRRRSRSWRKKSGDRGRDTTRGTTTTTTRTPTTETVMEGTKDEPTPSLSLFQPVFVSASHSPPVSPSSSSSSAKSYSNPYSTRKDRKRARRNQLRSFRNSYRMPPPPLEQIEVDSGSGIAARKREEKETKKFGEKKGKKGRPQQLEPTSSKSKSAIGYFTSVSAASVSASHSQSQSQVQSRSQSGSPSISASVTHTRSSSLERGRKPHVTGKTKKFAEAVSLALEEVTTRGRSVGGGVSPTLQLQSSSTTNASINTNEQQQQSQLRLSSKTKPITSNSTIASTSVVPVPSSGGGGGHSSTDLPYPSSNLGSIPFDEMEVLDISLPPGIRPSVDGGTDGGSVSGMDDGVVVVGVETEGRVGSEVEHQQEGKRKKHKVTISTPGGTSSSLPESGQFCTGDGVTLGGVRGLTATRGKPPPATALPFIPQLPHLSPRHDSFQQESQPPPNKRGSSLGREVPTIRASSSSSSNRQQYQYPYRNHQLQLQLAGTTGVSCGISVSRPPSSSSRPRPRPPTPLSAPSSASASVSQFPSSAFGTSS